MEELSSSTVNQRRASAAEYEFKSSPSSNAECQSGGWKSSWRVVYERWEAGWQNGSWKCSCERPAPDCDLPWGQGRVRGKFLIKVCRDAQGQAQSDLLNLSPVLRERRVQDTGLSLALSDHVTWILASDWSWGRGGSSGIRGEYFAIKWKQYESTLLVLCTRQIFTKYSQNIHPCSAVTDQISLIVLALKRFLISDAAEMEMTNFLKSTLKQTSKWSIIIHIFNVNVNTLEKIPPHIDLTFRQTEWVYLFESPFKYKMIWHCVSPSVQV